MQFHPDQLPHLVTHLGATIDNLNDAELVTVALGILDFRVDEWSAITPEAGDNDPVDVQRVPDYLHTTLNGLSLAIDAGNDRFDSGSITDLDDDAVKQSDAAIHSKDPWGLDAANALRLLLHAINDRDGVTLDRDALVRAAICASEPRLGATSTVLVTVALRPGEDKDTNHLAAAYLGSGRHTWVADAVAEAESVLASLPAELPKNHRIHAGQLLSATRGQATIRCCDREEHEHFHFDLPSDDGRFTESGDCFSGQIRLTTDYRDDTDHNRPHYSHKTTEEHCLNMATLVEYLNSAHRPFGTFADAAA